MSVFTGVAYGRLALVLNTLSSLNIKIIVIIIIIIIITIVVVVVVVVVDVNGYNEFSSHIFSHR